MKKALVLFGLALMLLGVRVGHTTIFDLRLTDSAVIRIFFDDSEISMDYAEVSILDRFDYFAIRIDTLASTSVESIFGQLGARRNAEHTVAGVYIVYGFSPYLRLFHFVNGQRTNVMISISNNTMSIGYPLLVGSF